MVDFVRQYRFTLILMVVLVATSVAVIHKVRSGQSRHVEIREAFILLYTRGYTNEANRLYEKLLQDLDKLPNKQVTDDFQRTLLLVDPSANQPKNLIWKYHWTVSNQMDKRSEGTLMRALKLAEEQK
jgi:hypothetical protein